MNDHVKVVKDYAELVVHVLTLVAVYWGLYFGYKRFGLKRERFAFLGVAIKAKPICSVQDLVLVDLTVHLENKGDTRISARQSRTNGNLNNEPLDICRHAGTLKIRYVPVPEKPLLFDWYSLPPIEITSRVVPRDQPEMSESDLEQINYLDEFQDPETGYQEVDFWIEPHETYDLTVFVWLRPGIYAAKAFFLGKLTKYREEEYWSNTILFSAAKPPESLDRI